MSGPKVPRLLLRLAFWIGVFLTLVVGVTVVLQRGDLRAACTEAASLRKARLLDASRQLYTQVRKADDAEGCAARGHAQVAHRERVRDLALMRARMYRRAAQLKRGTPLRGARRTAYFRAVRSYITALRRDSHAVTARGALRKLLNAQRGPASLTGFERRCALARRLTNAGLLPEANVVFATALRSGRQPVARSHRGCRVGLKALRTRRAKALAAWREGQLRERLGQDDRARSRFIKALAYDSALASAEAARKRVGSRSVRGDVARALETAGTDGSRWIQRAAAWVADRPVAVVVAATALALIILAALWLFHWLISLKRLRRVRRLLTWWPLRRFTDTTAEIAAIEGGPGMKSVLAGVLLVRPTDGSYGPDVQPPSDDVIGQAADEIIAQVPQLIGFSGVVKAARRLVPRHRFTIRGELIPSGPRGVGLAVDITDWRGRRQVTRTFWAQHWSPPTASDEDARFYLAVAAGWWVRSRLEQ